MVRSNLGVRLRDMWAAVAPIALALPFTWGACYAMAHSVIPSPAGISLVASVVVGLLAYAAVITLLERSLLLQALAQLRRVLGRSRPPGLSADAR
jgi:hypothetical protein